MIDSITALAGRWRSEAELLRRRGQEALAAMAESYADELEAAWEAWRNEELTVAQAAEESGYSKETLRRRVRTGDLPAERGNGKKSHITVRRGDLPQKPQRRQTNGGTSEAAVTYNPEEDARDIAQRLGRE